MVRRRSPCHTGELEGNRKHDPCLTPTSTFIFTCFYYLFMYLNLYCMQRNKSTKYEGNGNIVNLASFTKTKEKNKKGKKEKRERKHMHVGGWKGRSIHYSS